jgi:hypothetical protein
VETRKKNIARVLTRHAIQPRNAGSPSQPLDVPISIHSPITCRAPQPVRFGIPLARGVLREAEPLALDRQGQSPSRLQTRPLSHWSDGSIKWLLADFIAEHTKGEFEDGRIRSTFEDHAYPAASIAVHEHPTELVVDTGAAVFHLSRKLLQPIARVVIAGRDALSSSSITVRDTAGTENLPRVTAAVIEERGPIRVTVRLDATVGAQLPIELVTRLDFFAGTGLVCMRIVTRNPRRAQHDGGLWDLGDDGSVYFQDLSYALQLKAPASHVRWTCELGQAPQESAAGHLEIYQDSSGGDNWNCKNHVNREGRVPCKFKGYRVRTPGREEFGGRAHPEVVLLGNGVRVSATISEFWQQFPKAIEADAGTLRIGLFPAKWGDTHELQGGEQKTHIVWLCFDDAGDAEESALDWVHSPIRASVTPECAANSGAFDLFNPAEADGDERLTQLVASAVSGNDSFFAKRETIDEYGWRNYGDTFADHETKYYEGPRPVISHYNNQFDIVYGSFLQYLRTGDRAWVEIFDPLARHVIDVDIYHTEQDRPAYNGGLFWFTDHYKQAHTSTHRTFSRHNCKPGDRSYGGGPGSEHNFTTGLLHYYYWTGDSAAADAVLSLANWVIAMDDGTRNVLGIVDDGPTGLACCSDRGPGRGAGNSVSVLMDAWSLTREDRYLAKADEIIRRTVHPTDDVNSKHLLDVEKHWSYTVCLTSLAKYLEMKAEADQIDFSYAYARASLLHYAEWMADNERPYFDQAEKLEFPTEAWAAQEFRKANVLRLAAKYADPALRERLWRRGMELSDRAWTDLMRFESRTATRAMAVLMVEGTKDCYFRTNGLNPENRKPANTDFGTPVAFATQKQRVLRRLKTPQGIVQAMWRSLRPSAWRRWIRSRTRDG